MTTALLMIDIQQGMWMEEKPPHNDQAFLKNAKALLEKARAKGVPVIHIRHDGGEGDTLHEGNEGFAIRSEVAPKPKARRRCTPAPSMVGFDLISRFTGRIAM